MKRQTESRITFADPGRKHRLCLSWLSTSSLCGASLARICEGAAVLPTKTLSTFAKTLTRTKTVGLCSRYPFFLQRSELPPGDDCV